MLSRLKFEIRPLVEEILDQLPESVWTSQTTTFLDPAMAGGQFVAAIEARLRKYGHSDKNISGRVFGCEEHQRSVNYAIRKHGLVGEYWASDFLEDEYDMKFDVVVGNPPYQNRSDNSDGALWLQIINAASRVLTESGLLLFITPTSWVGKVTKTKKANFDIFTQNQVVYYKQLTIFEKKKYFAGIGSNFGIFLINTNASGPTSIITESKNVVNLTLVTGQSLPNRLTDEAMSIHIKLSEVEKFIVESNYKMHSQVLRKKGIVSDKKTNKFKHKTYFSHNLVRYSSEKQDIYSDGRVMLPIVGTLSNAWYGANCNSTEDVKLIFVNNKTEGENLVSVIKSKLFSYIGTQYRSGRNIGLALNFLPKVDLSRSWTDEELYDHFGLTQEERDYIEENVK